MNDFCQNYYKNQEKQTNSYKKNRTKKGNLSNSEEIVQNTIWDIQNFYMDHNKS